MTVPTYKPKIWAEAWRRPGHATFQKQIDDVPFAKASLTARGNGVGEGAGDLPSNYSRMDEVLKPDPTTPLNAVSSLIRIFQEGVTGPIGEWLPDQATGADSKDDTTVTVKGADIFSLLGHARVEAWDWTGIDDEVSKWPDWIYGGRNILGDLESVFKPAVTRFYRDVAVTGGTWIIGISFNGGAISNTNTIAWNVSSTALDTELTAELVAMGHATASVEVGGSGSATDPWRVQINSPEGELVLSVNSAGLTPSGRVNQDRETIGAIIPQGWTTSFNPVNNLSHGQVNTFRASHYVSPDPSAPACDTTGVAIMFDGDAGDFPGIQKIVPVKPGGRYYASATAYPQGANGTYRFVIRDLYENGIAAEPDFDTGTTITSNTWTVFDNMTSVVIPDDVDRVIVRFAAVDGSNPPPTFVTCLELREGMPPTTWGNIWTQLHADATSDHAARRVWQIGATAASYLTLDFNTTVDSAGAAWTHPLVSITLKRGQNYLRVASECFKQGYEGRIVPNNYVTGTWKFQLYNPGTAGTVLNAASSPVVMGGRDVSKRDVRKFLPTFTDWAVEAGGQAIARERSANAITALGRIEGYTPDQDLGSITEAGNAAATALATGLLSSQSLTYTVAGVQGAYPLVDYKVFDTINVDDPPDVLKTARRIRQIQLAWDKTGAEYTLQLGAESYVGVGAIYEGVNRLLTEFKAIRDRPGEATDPLNYFAGAGGGVPTIVMAAFDASDLSKSKADQGYVCSGDNDTSVFRRAAEYLNSISPDAGAIWLSEGNFNCYFNASQGIDMKSNLGIALIGAGRAATQINVMNAPTVANASFFEFSSWSRISDLTIIDDAYSATFPTILVDTGGSGDSVIERCNFYSGYGHALNIDNRITVRDCVIEAEQTVIYSIGAGAVFDSNYISSYSYTHPAVHMRNGATDWWLTNNYMYGGKQHLHVEDDGVSATVPGRWKCLNNYMLNSGYEGILVECERRGFAYNHIRGNLIQGGGQDIGAYANHGAITIIGDNVVNGLVGSSSGIDPGGSIMDNTIEANNLHDGIRLINVHGVRVIGNYIEDVQGHGIALEGTSDAVLSLNQVAWYDGISANTYDCYFIDANSDRNNIQSNQAINGFGGSDFRYGFNINNANCDENVMVANLVIVQHNAFGTASYRDAGTGTQLVYPGAAAPQGDNFIA